MKEEILFKYNIKIFKILNMFFEEVAHVKQKKKKKKRRNCLKSPIRKCLLASKKVIRGEGMDHHYSIFFPNKFFYF